MQCPTCGRSCPEGTLVCPDDGALLGPPATGGDALVGTVVDGRYEVVERLGAGGFGAVYRARQTSIQRDVAIKFLHRELAEDADAVRRFVAEARIISSLRHPGTLKLIDFGRTPEGRLYTVTELLRGETLAERLARAGALDAITAIRVLLAVCEALVEAHGRGIVHRDLKPANIHLEDVEGLEFVRVLDFGIAKASEGSAGRTTTGRVFGTPAYMSPEQAAGQAVDARSDLYSLGIVAYECLAGSRPFVADTPLSLLMKQVHDAPPSLREHVVDPRATALVPLVESLLAKSPGERPPDATTVRDTLSALLRTLDALAPTLAPVGPPPQPAANGADETLSAVDLAPVSSSPPAGRSRRPMTVGVLVAATVLSMGGYFALRPPRVTPPDRDGAAVPATAPAAAAPAASATPATAAPVAESAMTAASAAVWAPASTDAASTDATAADAGAAAPPDAAPADATILDAGAKRPPSAVRPVVRPTAPPTRREAVHEVDGTGLFNVRYR